MNVCLLNVGLQLYREVCLCNTVLASHIDTTALADGTILTEDPDQSSEEPKANLASDYREGKPRT